MPLQEIHDGFFDKSKLHLQKWLAILACYTILVQGPGIINFSTKVTEIASTQPVMYCTSG